jgi:flagellar export protein FliJ
MKTFIFRLEQALRWRETQVDLQKSRVAGAAARLAEIAALLEARRIELANAAARLSHAATGVGLGSYAGFKDKSGARIRDLEAQALVAQRTLTLEMNRLIEANQRLKLVENLKHNDQGQWHRKFERELAAFADEAFLCRTQPTRKQGRSRSDWIG